MLNLTQVRNRQSNSNGTCCVSSKATFVGRLFEWYRISGQNLSGVKEGAFLMSAIVHIHMTRPSLGSWHPGNIVTAICMGCKVGILNASVATRAECAFIQFQGNSIL